MLSEHVLGTLSIFYMCSTSLMITNMIPSDPANISIVDVQAHDKSAFVSWDVKSQDACRGAVVNFTVYYGAQDEAELGESPWAASYNEIYCLRLCIHGSSVVLFFQLSLWVAQSRTSFSES